MTQMQKVKIGNKINVAKLKSFNQSGHLSEENIPSNQDFSFNQTEKDQSQEHTKLQTTEMHHNWYYHF
jgi:hypothetical protein